MKFICRKCEKVTSGTRAEHCPACHETFTSTASGDMHRTDRHGITDDPDARRCLTPVEMLQRGMTTDQRGFWTAGRRWHGPVSPAGGDSTASQPSPGGLPTPAPERPSDRRTAPGAGRA